MNSKTIVTYGAIGVLALGAAAVAACGPNSSTHAHVVPKVTSGLNTPQGKRAEAIVQSCLNRNTSPAAIKNCLVPKHHAHAFEICAYKASTLYISNHAALKRALATCLLDNR